MRTWLDGHREEQEQFKQRQEAKYAVKGTGVRDLDYDGAAEKKGERKLKRGYLYRQDCKGKSFNGHKVWAEEGGSASDPTSFSLYSGQSKNFFLSPKINCLH